MHTARLEPTRSLSTLIPSTLLAALGCGLLAARPLLTRTGHEPYATLVLLFVGLGAAGLLAPVPPTAARARGRWSSGHAIMIGVGIFALGRVLAGGAEPGPLAVTFVLGNTLAAVAEEIWFRRLCFGLLTPGGPVLAIAGSSLLFALIHVPTYGWSIVPLDLAAGAVLGWQRHVTGSWHASAATHAVANVFVVL